MYNKTLPRVLYIIIVLRPVLTKCYDQDRCKYDNFEVQKHTE